MGPNVEAVKANGITFHTETASESGGDGLLTYKRRRNVKVAEAGKISKDSLSQPSEKLRLTKRVSLELRTRRMKESRRKLLTKSALFKGPDRCLAWDSKDDCRRSNTNISSRVYGPSSTKRQSRCSNEVRDPLNETKDMVVLEQLLYEVYPMLDAEAPGRFRRAVKHVHDLVQCFHNGSHSLTFLSNDCSLKHQRNIILEQISQSLDNEGGLNKCIRNALVFHPGSGSRTSVKESFHSCEDWSKCTSQTWTLNGHQNAAKDNEDIQEIWTKLQKVGSDITALAKCLSDKTTTSFHEQLGNSAFSIPQDSKYEFHMQEPDVQTKAERIESCALDDAHTCQQCKEKADGRNGLVCDSCEGMYHLSCIEPAVKEIPTRSWYCANCTAKGIESSHENCIACERLNASRSPFNEFVYDEITEELEETSNELATNEGSKRFPQCKACRTEVRNDEEYRICGHSFCPHKFYHVKCLTSKQLISYGPCWYCPSCLCRACLTDQDDDKIVLCDGCDHAYHIYCMDPPRAAIPKGKWFCQKCDSGIQRIRKARQTYENTQNVSKKRGVDGELKGKEALNKSGGVDMLLNAAKTLNYEENLVSMGLKTD
ncbi:hypothetical protein DH2020_007873 [Rehmannia glutinosa]|uniref:PHD-type domain-containing protein n=1 Tax=Rehmannia glutinosa TaxID=99300 RepID=A0ABR0TZS2_REHGL